MWEKSCCMTKFERTVYRKCKVIYMGKWEVLLVGRVLLHRRQKFTAPYGRKPQKLHSNTFVHVVFFQESHKYRFASGEMLWTRILWVESRPTGTCNCSVGNYSSRKAAQNFCHPRNFSFSWFFVVFLVRFGPTTRRRLKSTDCKSNWNCPC